MNEFKYLLFIRINFENFHYKYLFVAKYISLGTLKMLLIYVMNKSDIYFWEVMIFFSG